MEVTICIEDKRERERERERAEKRKKEYDCSERKAEIWSR